MRTIARPCRMMPTRPRQRIRRRWRKAKPRSVLVAAVRKELKPPVSGFFVVTPNAPVQGALVGDRLELRCSNNFTAQMLDRPEILEVVSRKATAMLSHPVKAATVDMSAKPAANPRMEQLMNFGRAHSDIVTIKR